MGEPYWNALNIETLSEYLLVGLSGEICGGLSCVVSRARRRRLNAYERLDKADRNVFDASSRGIEDELERREEEEVRIKERSKQLGKEMVVVET